MTFSDAEEDQPSTVQNGTATPNSVSGSSTNSSDVATNVNQAECSSNTKTEGSGTSDLPRSSSCTPTSVSTAGSTVTSSTTASCIVTSSGSSSTVSPSSQQNGATGSPTSQPPDHEASNLSSVSTSQPASLQLNTESVVGSVENNGLETEKVMEKLQQIHGYIQQTAAAMQALEHEGDLSKIGQYNTLVKCIRELKKSEAKLTSHLNKLKVKPSQSELDLQDCLLEQFEALYNSLQCQENECIEILSKSLINLDATQPSSENANEANHSQRESGTSGSASIGVVGTLNEDGRQASMHDRLARHESEQLQLSERLRESLVRREELMARYHATRERLNNLKRQRLGLVQEERRVLQSGGAPENPYDDPIPGSETWTSEQLENAIRDFEGLRDKLDHLHQAYSTKLQALDENDSESRSDLQRKIEQIINKKRQVGNALSQMAELLLAKSEREEAVESLSALASEQTVDVPSNSVPAPMGNSDPFPTENARAPSEDVMETPEGEVMLPEGAVGMTPEAKDILAKQQHLQSLKNQLNAMKRLLHISQDVVPGSRNSAGEEMNDDESISGRDNAEGTVEEHEGSIGHVGEMGEPLVDSTIIGVNGEVIHLTESERRNPQVVSKFHELSLAKKRLAKMEEVMTKIAEARQSGRTLSDVLSPENMAILNEAKEEDARLNVHEMSPANFIECRKPIELAEINPESMRASNEVPRQAQKIQRNPKIPLNTPPKKNQEKPSNGRSEWEREKEISAMQYHLKKKTPVIPPINEGFKVGREKGAIKKQTRDLLNESGGDPRLMEVIALQEELKEKKNALEALMRRMGKSSSFTLDNISDNISENVSDVNSETMERPSASWGASHSQSRYYSDHCQTDEDLMDVNDEEFSLGYGAIQSSLNSHQRHSSLPHLPSNAKNRNRLSSQKLHHNPDNNQFSVNNLSAPVPKSVRPKHNRNPDRNVPATSWENIANPNVSTSQNSSNNKVQNTVAAALSQLAQVQDTINTLYGELRAAEMSARQQEVPVLNTFGNNTMVPQPSYNAAVPHTLLPNYCMSPLPNSQGRGDLGASNHILAGLQQCFSQLYLHSLEIQSLSKHLQIIDQREKSVSPSHQRGEQRGGSVERRSERHSVGRRVNESPQQNYPQRFNPNFHTQSNPRYEDRKSDAYVGRSDYPNSRTNESFPRNGVSNPLYARLCNTQQPSSWQMDASEELDVEFGNKNFSPFDGSASDEVQPSNGDLLLDSSSHFPLEAEEMNDDLPWTSVPSSQIHQPSSDILNNQVLPGTRANNYWDNFRSYSRQNPLSTTAKCNTGEQLSLSGSSTPGRGQSLNTGSQGQQSASFENKNRHFNVTTCPSNSINKASDKNSSSSRSQNKGGARSRFPSHQVDGRRATIANSSYQYNVASPSGQRLENDSCKRNNRPDFRTSYEQECFNQHESNQNHGCVNNEEALFNVNASPLSSNNSRRFARERAEPAPRNSEENASDFFAGPNMNIRRQNTVSHGDLNASETFSQVIKEAESLMQKHSEQPQFLLQLFHHASKITGNTDQQVALELLRELSYQRQQNNIQHNRWTSNSSVTHSDNFSLRTPLRDTNYRNITRFSNKNCRNGRDISGSDASESGITSDEDDTKVLNQMVKNLTPTSSSVGVYPPLRSSPQVFSDQSNNPSSVGVSPIHASNSLAQNQQPRTESRKDFSKDIMNNVVPSANKDRRKSENQHQGSRLQRKKEEVEAPFRNYLPTSTSCDSPSAPFNSLTTSSTKSNSKSASTFEQSYFSIGDKYNNKRQMRKSPRRNLAKAAEEKSNFSFKNAKKNFNPKVPHAAADDLIQEPVSGFEAIVSASLREVLMCFENADYSLASTSQILDNLLHSIMRQVQFHSSTLGFSSNFVSSIDSQLKATLRGFHGKTLPAIRQELAAAVTQVLVQEYCSLFMQQDNLSEARQNQMQESNCINEVRPTNKSDSDVNKRTLTPQFNKQPSSNSLFGPQETVLKQGRPAANSWTFNPAIQSDSGQGSRELYLTTNVLAHSKEEESKCDATNPKGKGAISKNSGANCGSGSSHPEDSLVVNQEGSNSLSRESPLPEASSFPESWVIQRAGSNTSDVEGVYSFTESSFMREREERDFLNVMENAKLERNDAEADQDDHTRNKDLLSLSLPVHDLAEADQSQDPIEGDCVDSSIENDHYEASAPAYSQPLQEPKEFAMRFIPKKKATSNNDIPEQGLDEVPTRLLSATEGASPPVTMNGRHLTEEGNEAKITPHRYGPFPSQVSPPHSQATNVTVNDHNASHQGEASSGKGG